MADSTSHCWVGTLRSLRAGIWKGSTCGLLALVATWYVTALFRVANVHLGLGLANDVLVPLSYLE